MPHDIQSLIDAINEGRVTFDSATDTVVINQNMKITLQAISSALSKDLGNAAGFPAGYVRYKVSERALSFLALIVDAT